MKTTLCYVLLSSIFVNVFIFSQCLSAPTKRLSRVNHLGNETDHAALMSIKNQLVDSPGGVLSSWNNSLHHCYWDGVACGLKHNRVIGLDLNSRGLVGTISPFIGNLSFFRDLRLYNNSLLGKIPPEIGRLFRLQSLRLYNNSFDGQIPVNLSACINLEWLSLVNNKLQGKLPLELKALTKLRFFAVSSNNFTGPLFDILSNLTSLEVIYASYNAFTGKISNNIGNMKNLKNLLFAENMLSGTIPTSFLNCSAIDAIDINDNDLQGELPPDIGLRLPRLIYCELSYNLFSGSFPYSISNLTNLEYLALDDNSFVGRVPRDFGHFQKLWFLGLSFNYLQGDINFVGTLTNCSKLEIMQSGGNEFTGVLPKSVANLSTSLRLFILEDNRITGEIPTGITNLINLEVLIFDRNNFTGSIPGDLGKLRNLQSLRFEYNRLSGEIPNSFTNLSRLSKLLLNNNRLEGNIPLTLGGCQSLLDLDLSSNRLNGTLMDELFKGSAKFISLLLHDNLLVGSIPSEISMQVNLEIFSVSQNRLSGSIPDGLGQCLGLTSLDIHGNFLGEDIPASLSSLGSLQTADFSRNNLSGRIPNYFSKFPLQWLNLSSNNFEGEVPTTGVFANVSGIALKRNVKLCGGIPKLHLQRCIQGKEIKTRRNLSLAVTLTIIVCVFVGVFIVATWLYLSYRRKKMVSISFSSMGERFMKVSYDKLLKATNGFSSVNLVGAGSFGSVFRGNLDGKTVAVKVLNLQTRGASKSFMAECKALQNVRHRNLVGIITVCASIDHQRNDFRALVYEFMPNGNLDSWLHENGGRKLTLFQRLDIAIDVANALDYLHNYCEIPIIHCDLKPSNILLDNDKVAYVGDFGLAKFLAQPRHPNQSSSIGVLGTIGYVAPEYGLGSESSLEGDLYSYGILLLELMTGKRPTNNIFQEGYNLQTYAEEALPDNVLKIVDPTMEDNEFSNEDGDNMSIIQAIAQQRMECIISVVGVGIACSKHLPQDRMKISEALIRVRAAKDYLRGSETLLKYA